MSLKNAGFIAFFYLIISISFFPLAFAQQGTLAGVDVPVPKSETVVISNVQNDSKDRAQSFDNELEYTFGSSSDAQANSRSLSINSAGSSQPVSWRKTSFSKPGTMVVTLDFDSGSDYNIEVFNSCSLKNYCQSYRFANFKTCILNIQPGEYFFKVSKLSGAGNYTLDVDLIPDRLLARVNAWECPVACSANADCEDNNAFTFDNCVFPGTPQSYCSHVPVACNSAADCDDSNPLTVDSCSFPGIADSSCSHAQTDGLLLKNPSNNADINDSQVFSWVSSGFSEFKFQVSSSSNFKVGLEVKSSSQFVAAKKQFSKLLELEKKAANKILYWRVVGKKANGQSITSSSRPFKIAVPASPILSSPLNGASISSSQVFSWNNGGFSEFTLQVGKDASFKKKSYTEVASRLKASSTVISSKNWKKVLDLAKKNPTLYWRIVGKDAYGRVGYSQAFSFKIFSSTSASNAVSSNSLPSASNFSNAEIPSTESSIVENADSESVSKNFFRPFALGGWTTGFFSDSFEGPVLNSYTSRVYVSNVEGCKAYYYQDTPSRWVYGVQDCDFGCTAVYGCYTTDGNIWQSTYDKCKFLGLMPSMCSSCSFRREILRDCSNSPTCSNECSSGDSRCNGSVRQACGNFDSDSCLEWPSSTSGSGNESCPSGCSGGTCNSQPSCSDACRPFQTRITVKVSARLLKSTA